jgi:hypothetical protein
MYFYRPIWMSRKLLVFLRAVDLIPGSRFEPLWTVPTKGTRKNHNSFSVRFDFSSNLVRSIRLFCQFDLNLIQ